MNSLVNNGNIHNGEFKLHKDLARMFINRGFLPIPCDIDKPKKPSIRGYNGYTEIPHSSIISGWFSEPHDMAIATGLPSGNLAILEFDCMDTFEAWKSSVDSELFNRLPLVLSSSGKGYHVWFRTESVLRSNDYLARSEDGSKIIELKADRRKIMAPIKQSFGEYRPVSGHPHPLQTPTITDAEAKHLVDTAAGFNQFVTPERTEGDFVEWDEASKQCTIPIERRIEAAEKHLEKCDAPVSGEGRAEAYVFKLAIVLVWGYLVPEEDAIDLLYEWGKEGETKDGYADPWSETEITHKVLGALAEVYDGTPGDRLPDLAYEKVNEIVKPPAIELDFEFIENNKPAILTDEELAELHSQSEAAKKQTQMDNLYPLFKFRSFDRSKRYKQLIEATIYEQSLVLLYGPKSSLKSFLALDWVLCMALGLPWNGKRTKRSKVLYIYAEAANNLWDRIQVWFISKGLEVPEDFDDWFVGIPTEVKLDDPECRENLINTINHHGLGYAVIVVDTVDRNMTGIEDQVGMKAMVDAIKALLRFLSNTIILIHHTGKDITRGEKGDGRLGNASDTIFMLTRNGSVDKPGKCVKLINVKQKVISEDLPQYFGFNVLETGDLDEYNKPITSLALHRATEAEYETKANGDLSPSEFKVFDELNGIFDDSDKSIIKDGFTQEQLVKETKCAKGTVSKACKVLVNSGLIAEKEIEGKNYYWRPILT